MRNRRDEVETQVVAYYFLTFALVNLNKAFLLFIALFLSENVEHF